MSYDAVLFFDGPGFCADVFFFPKHFITYPLTCFTGLWELWHVHFLFPSCNMGCAKGMQSLLQRCIVAVCGRVGWAFIPTFCTAGCEEPPSARSFQSHGIRGAARSSERSYEPRFFFCRQIGKFVIIRLWIWIFFRFFLQIKSTKSETRRWNTLALRKSPSRRETNLVEQQSQSLVQL